MMLGWPDFRRYLLGALALQFEYLGWSRPNMMPFWMPALVCASGGEGEGWGEGWGGTRDVPVEGARREPATKAEDVFYRATGSGPFIGPTDNFGTRRERRRLEA